MGQSICSRAAVVLAVSTCALAGCGSSVAGSGTATTSPSAPMASSTPSSVAVTGADATKLCGAKAPSAAADPLSALPSSAPAATSLCVYPKGGAVRAVRLTESALYDAVRRAAPLSAGVTCPKSAVVPRTALAVTYSDGTDALIPLVRSGCLLVERADGEGLAVDASGVEAWKSAFAAVTASLPPS